MKKGRPEKPVAGAGLAWRTARKAKGWSQAQAAQETGITQGLIAKIESGERPNPTLKTIAAAANAYGVSIASLMGGVRPAPGALQTAIDAGLFVPPLSEEEIASAQEAQLPLGGEPTPGDWVLIVDLMRRLRK